MMLKGSRAKGLRSRGSRIGGSRAKRSRVAAIVEALHRSHPSPKVELDHDGPFQLLVATILSAQCTDARVNQVTPYLFKAYPDAASLARAPTGPLERAIRSTGFFRAKTRSLKRCSQALVERHGGRIPRSLEDLTRLPGIGRKTAHVILGAGFGIASGIVVDTHMARVAGRLGLTGQTDPVRIERDLTELVPASEWIFFSVAMILHGRYVCQARRPRCSACALRPHCPSGDLEERGAGGRRRTGRRGSSQRSGRKPRADSSVSCPT
jgi:endonuclease-3